MKQISEPFKQGELKLVLVRAELSLEIVSAAHVLTIYLFLHKRIQSSIIHVEHSMGNWKEKLIEAERKKEKGRQKVGGR